MESYETLVEALEALKKQGYTHDFNIKNELIECMALNLRLNHDEFEVTHVYRFEGMTNPDDQSVLYAIESNSGIKGTLVNAYGIYSDPVSDKLMAKLTIKH